MQKGYGEYWRRLGRIEKAFLILALLYIILYFTRATPTLQAFTALTCFILGIVTLFRLARRAMKKAIWRLRNRLIAAYLFIAVVPIVLILSLVMIAGWAVIGQMAVYLVNTEIGHRKDVLLTQARILGRFPVREPEVTVSRFNAAMARAFPDCRLLISGHDELRFPENADIEQPPAGWKQEDSGLVIKTVDGEPRLLAWAHVRGSNGNEVTITAPVTHDVLAGLIPGLGDVNFTPILGHIRTSHVPAPMNTLDFELSGVRPILVPHWESPAREENLLLLVNTRLSAVLGIVFNQLGQKMNWGEMAFGLFIGVTILFLIVELASLVAGISLSRSITGAVHELYLGTQHVKEGDFAFRVPVKGHDQLAELTTSFNTMTQNLGQLIVVAKEKERLESELAIAREVQDQLFPKDAPFMKHLELKGVCNPARMVSGDYYDFMPLSDHSLAFAIGDVAGKGISAALLMATIQSTMRTQLSSSNGSGPAHLSSASLVANLNKLLYATTAPEKYATFYFALYDDTSNTLTYTNAGHLAPILLRGTNIQTLDSTGTVVGAFPIARYGEKTVQLDQGDILVAYTDGIVEPENAYGEMYGEERLMDLLVKYSKADSSEIIARTMEAVNQWTGAGELQDDMTMLVARRL
jgi:sigma-B regulation protein RsbU (phosphoserine phosphatase)